MTPSRRSNGLAKRVAFTGMLFAVALVLSIFESMLPVLPMLPPGVKLGLSNIVTMYALFTLGVREGLTIAVLKAFSVFLLRGFVAAALSLSGGLTSVCVMLLLSLLPEISKNYLILSIFGAIGHNVGQLILSRYLLGTTKIFYLLPLLVLSGIGMGIVTGIVLKAVMPYINRLNLK